MTASPSVTRPYQFARLSTRGTLVTFEMRSNNVGVFEPSGDTARPLARDGTDLYRDFMRTYEDILAQVRESAAARRR